MPVFILAAYDENNVAQAMNAAWGGISNSCEISMCISAGHKTMKSILATKAFTVSMGTAAQLVACDYVGIASGNNVPDKLAKTGWHIVQSEFVNAPLFEELPMGLDCTLESYDPSTGRLVGRIVNVNADESILNEQGTIDAAKLEPVMFDPVHNDYFVLGKKVGGAFSDGKKMR